MERASELASEVDQLDRDVRSARQRITDLHETLARTRANREYALDQLGLDEANRPLALAPLVWALVGAICGLSAAFTSYLSVLMAGDSDFPVAWTVTAGLIIIAAATLSRSARPGAGGSARRKLRTVTIAVGYTAPFVLAITPFI